MAYLDNRSITVDAVLTKKGRELLSRGHDFFKISKFALSDDEVDYRLWDNAHPSGSNYYGYAIEQMPILEAPVDETQSMRYKLVSLDKSTTRIPVVTVSPTTAILKVAGDTVDITPGTLTTATGVSFNQTLGYTCILHNSDAATLIAIESISNTTPSHNASVSAIQESINNIQAAIQAAMASGNTSQLNTLQQILKNQLRLETIATKSVSSQSGAGIFLSDSELAKSIWVTGTRFRVVAKRLSYDINTVVTIVGNESGGSATMSLTVKNSAAAELPPSNLPPTN